MNIGLSQQIGLHREEGIRQTRSMSLFEAATNVVIGFFLALLTQIAVFPLFGLQVAFGDNLLLGGLFTIVSIVRSYVLRRVFERFRHLG